MKIAIGSTLNREQNLPLYLSPLFSSVVFQRHKVQVFLYGAQNPKESITKKIFLLPLKLLSNTVRIIIFQPNIIHLHSAFDMKGVMRDILYIFIFWLLRKKVCIEFHGSDLAWASRLSMFSKGFLPRWLSKADRLFVLSSEEKTYFESQWRLRNIAVVKLPLSMDDSTLNCKETKGENTTLLFVGRVMKTKGVRDIIKAIALLRDMNFAPIPYVRIVGDGPDIERCQQLTTSEGLTSYIQFTGWVTEAEVQKEYLRSDLFLLPSSHQEGLPKVILYALKYGLPIITTKIRGMADYLHELNNCLFTEPKNPMMLAEKIKYLIEHPELREQMTRNNRELARQFDKEIVAKQLEEVYSEILNKRRDCFYDI